MVRGRKKGLTSEDIALWSHVTKGVTAKHKSSAMDVTVVKRTPVAAAPQKMTGFKPFHIGEKSLPPSQTAVPDFRSAPSATSPNMDRRNFQRLLKGKMDIEATLDLHGMTADQAKQHLTVFLRTAHRRQLRMILVITGKGRIHGVDEFNRPKGGVLRQGLPDWLAGPALAHLVLQVTPAQQRHGGSGAWYVYLRRIRS